MVGLGVGVDDDVLNVDGAELVILLEKEIHGPLKMAGALQRSKGMTRNWKEPERGWKAVRSRCLGSTWIWWNPDRRSILENTREPAMESRHSSMRGMGYTNFWANALRQRYSMQRRSPPTCLFAKSTPAPNTE